MNPADPYGAGEDEHGELPQLPIPRPGEWSPMAAAPAPQEPRLAPPALGGGLGGGASFTSVGDGDGDAAPDEGQPITGPAWEQAERERIETERFTWELAARLTSGLLANPARGTASVKDAMGLFDQLLQEMHSYTKLATEFDLLGGEAARRRSREEYYQHQRTGASAQPTAEVPLPAPLPTATAPKPEPTQPRPMGDYRPIPPGSRGPYAPGSMAGTPPPEKPAEGPGEQAA